jgi:hypothetical protein
MQQYGIDINSLKPAEIESIQCPVCGSTGKCFQMGTPLRVERNDYHAERKLAAGNEKLQIQLVIAQQALEAEQRANEVLADEVMHAEDVPVVPTSQAAPVVAESPAVSSSPSVEDVNGLPNA